MSVVKKIYSTDYRGTLFLKILITNLLSRVFNFGLTFIFDFSFSSSVKFHSMFRILVPISVSVSLSTSVRLSSSVSLQFHQQSTPCFSSILMSCLEQMDFLFRLTSVFLVGEIRSRSLTKFWLKGLGRFHKGG